MVRVCTMEDEHALLEYLERDAVFHTFLLADIRNYGFDKEFQTVYGDFGDGTAGTVRAVYLKFYGNLIVAGTEEALDSEFLEILFGQWKPDVVMGRAELVEVIGKLLPDYCKTEKYLYMLNAEHQEDQESFEVRRGVLGDEDKIHGFLMSIPEIKALYTSKDMIRERLVAGDGTHLYLEQDGEVIAHVNSAARSPYAVMIGGVAVKEEERGKNLAVGLVSRLCQEILREGRKPSLFCDRGPEHNLFVHLGFEEAGIWGTLTKLSEDGPSKLPSYIPIYNRLYQDLMDGVYEKDSLLPSENVLAAAYKVSRNTLRQALTILCQDGYIYKHQGKGTFVSYDRNKSGKKKICNFARESAMESVKEVLMDYNTGLPTNIARTKLSLTDGEWVFACNTVYVNEEGAMGQVFLQVPIKVLTQAGVWTSGKEQAVVTGVLSRDKEQELQEFIEQGIYERAVSADVSVKVMMADEQVIPYMKIAEGTVLLFMEQMLFDQDRNALARVKYFFLPDRYQVDFSLWV